MKHVSLVCLCWICLWVSGHAQKYVQLERTGTLKTIRFSEGDVLTFKLRHDDKGWYKRMISSIDVPGNRIVFQDVPVHIDSIEAIRLDKKSSAAQIIGTVLQVGGVNLILFTGYYAIFQDTGIEWKSMISGVANIVVGTGIKKLFRYSTFRMSQRKRIRLLDLYFQAPSHSEARS